MNTPTQNSGYGSGVAQGSGSASGRVPPKFVPTLTEVVHLDPPAPPSPPVESNESMLYSEFSGQSGNSDVSDQPQAIADDIVFAPSQAGWSQQESGPSEASQTSQPVVQNAPASASMYDLSPEIQEQIVHRVMQRVDLSLEMRLRDAVEAVMLDHTRNLAPRLREEIEWVVRQSVAEAIAAELERGI